MKRLLVLLLSLSTFACGPAEPAQLTIDNSVGQLESNALGTFRLHWDVKVVLNGVDFGVIKGGDKSEVKTIEANTLTFDTFEVQAQSNGKSIYGVKQSDPSGPHFFFDDNDYGFAAKAADWKRATVSVALFGNREKTVKIGFGETVPTR